MMEKPSTSVVAVYLCVCSDCAVIHCTNKHKNVLQVKPAINQVNLTTCCVIPQDLTEFAKEHDIQLLTHNDPPGK